MNEPSDSIQTNGDQAPYLTGRVIIRAYEQLQALENPPPSALNDKQTPLPNDTAFSQALEILSGILAQGLVPDRIIPSAEGGIALIFLANGRYADIECFNDGEVCALTSGEGLKPRAWEVDPANLSDTVRDIRDHARPATTATNVPVGTPS